MNPIKQRIFGCGVSFMALLSIFQLAGCDYDANSVPQQPAAVRRPDFEDGPLTVYYTSETTADIVLAGVTHKIRHGVAQSSLPFEYEWEEDGDIDLLYQGISYEVESPYDVADDALELLDGKKKHKKKAVVGMAAFKKASPPAPSTPLKFVSGTASKAVMPPLLPKKASPPPAPKAKPASKSSARNKK